MNYVSHLNAIFRRFAEDRKLNPTHISLYIALFQFWNISHFAPILYINREEVMRLSKIGSKDTYHKNMRQLHRAKYLEYIPSHNPFKSSQVKLFKFGTSSGTTGGTTTGTSNEQVVGLALGSYKNNIKQSKTFGGPPQSKEEVIRFFKEKGWTGSEAEKFYNHYNGVGWKTGGKLEIKNWHSIAENWVLRADALELKEKSYLRSGKVEHLKISKTKNYGEPL